MITFILNKLVRDKSPARMEKAGITSQYRIVKDQQLLVSLQKKLIEEALEVTEAQNRQEVVGELADLAEVIVSFKHYYSITDEEVAAEKKIRYDQRGGFEQGIFMEKIMMAEDNPRVAHFKASPEKYREE